jgi:hypothetical protein
VNSQNVIIIRAEDQASQTLDAVANSIDAMVSRLTTAAGIAAGAVASIAASKALIGASNGASEAFLEQKEAARGLTEEQTKYAAAMQNLLGVQDEVTNRAMNQAKLLGVQESQLEDVTTAALGLSQATGQSLTSSIMKVNEAITGNANALASYLPAIREVETEEEKLAIIQEAAARGLQDRADQTSEEIGAINRRKAAMQDLYAAIGRVVAPSVKAQDAITVLATMSADAINSMIDHITAGVEAGSSIVGRATEFMFEAAVSAIAGIETAFTNFDNVIELFTAGFEYDVLYWTRTLDDFGKNTANIFEWLKDNILNVWGDLGRATLAIFRNMGHNIGEVVAAVSRHIVELPKMIATGMSRVDIAKEFTRKLTEDTMFQGLMDGYKPLAQVFPDMIVSAATERESELVKRMAEIGEAMGISFSDAFESRMDWAKGMIERFREGLDLPKFDLDAAAKAADAEGGISKGSGAAILESRLLSRGAGGLAEEQLRATKDNVESTNQARKAMEALKDGADAILEKWDRGEEVHREFNFTEVA